jgi:hypothetical protein
MDIKPWPAKSDEVFSDNWYPFEVQKQLAYERAMKEAYAARLKYLVEAANEASAELDDDCPISAARGLRKALADIGELPND